MNAPNVDIVIVVDASDSMSPCFKALSENLQELVKPMQGYVNNVRFSILTHLVSSDGNGNHVYFHQSLCSENILNRLYGSSDGQNPLNGDDLFTTDGDKIIQVLKSTEPKGNEELLIALDIALDFPFGEVSNTKRVVALFSDERLEDGITKGKYLDKIPDIVDKIHNRRIKLFAALPGSEGLWTLGEADQSEIEDVDGGNGLQNVDFAKLLEQMGKSISGSSLQAVGEPSYKKAIFEQDKWGLTDFTFNDSNRRDS